MTGFHLCEYYEDKLEPNSRPICHLDNRICSDANANFCAKYIAKARKIKEQRIQEYKKMRDNEHKNNPL